MDIPLQVVLSPFLGVLFDRMSKPEFLNLFRKRKYDDRILKKLELKLLILQAVLEDAETKQSKNSAVNKWLDQLQEVLYQADDLLDQINTEVMRVKVESQFTSPTNQVSASSDPSNFSVEFLKEIMPKLDEIVQQLEDFEQRIGILGLIKEVESKKRPFRPSSTSTVDENDVYGRDADKEEIIQALLFDVANRENFSVISIVGLGGVGKTTLAQLVYNDERVKFDTKAWICISEEYDATRITKELLKELKICFDSIESFVSLQKELKEGLCKKKFLVVLDDIWNRDYNDWLALSSLFNGGEKGSKILVTTRDEKVALMMGSQHIFGLDRLSESDCWSLFKRHAFTNRDDTGNSEFELAGKEIVKKCGGLPLAVKAIAGLLRSKQTIEEWDEILRSDEWAETNNQAGILPSLKLSHTHLSSYLKRCFGYCAVFHKGYQFSKDEVILLWMANDLLERPRSNKRLEDIGNEFFRELIARSLFQRSCNGKFSMHDLVNDLAKYVSGKYILRLEDHWQQNDSFIVVRHFSYISSDTDVFEKFKHLNKSKFLRTFLPIQFRGCEGRRLSKKFLLDILPACKSLRVLSLYGYEIIELSNSFVNLKQLRFLDLSFTCIEKLPSWICTFCNLESLLLAHCNLKELPEDMEKLINLRYLDVSGVPLTKMPMEIGRLENLQFLSTFIVSKHGGPRIEGLGKLCNLHGKFTISGLENVSNGKNASMAKMKEKKYTKELTLEWNGDSDNSQVAQNVCKELKPHRNIEVVKINGYCGTRFPNWLEDPSFCNMVSLSISECKNCFYLPAIGQLPFLKYISISGLSKVIELGPEIYGDGCGAKPFPCLKELRIASMEEWREWHIPGNGVFSCLEELYIVYCPKLIGEIPKQLPSLKKLIIIGCRGLVNAEGELNVFYPEANFSSLRELRIGYMRNMKKLLSMSLSLNKVFPRLESLVIGRCNEMVSIPIRGLPTTLKRLEVADAGNLEQGTRETCHLSIEDLSICGGYTVSTKNLSLGLFHSLQSLSLYEVRNIEELSIPTSLHSLGIGECDDLISFTVGALPASNLTQISLYSLLKLKSLPERMHALFPSLQSLTLWGCPEIECIPEGGLPSTLQSLRIWHCKRLWSCRRGWGLHTLPSLTTFIFNDGQETFPLKHLLLPSTLTKEETFPPEDLLLPSTLTTLKLCCHKNVRTLNYGVLQHLTCLEELRINCCPKLCSLPEEGLPASLSTLEIRHCPELLSLPEKGLPPSLSELRIYNCSLLKQRLEREKGEDWQKVAHIPCIQVDDELLP